jgi:predicted nucleotidyltransferase
MDMQFHDFVEMLFGSKVKVMVLRTLWKHGEKEFTIRELAKFLGISHTGVKKVLDELEGMNAIRVRTSGRSYAFKLNANSYAASIVEKTFEMERGALSELRGILRGKLKSPWVTSAALFGSIADGKEMSRSDIDLLIVTDRRKEVEEIVVELQRDVADRFGNSISVYYVGEEDFQKRREQSPIKQALQSHVLVCGKPLE